MLVTPIAEAQADDFIIDLTPHKPNSDAATAAGFMTPLTRHQITVIMAGAVTPVTVTVTAKPTGTSAFEPVVDGILSIAGGEQVTIVVRDCSLDEIKIGTGVLASNTYTLMYVGSGDYSEGY